jgi:hypothetical protein
LHRHKEALGHAKAAISISHYLVKDIHKLIKYYVNRFRSPIFNFTNEILNQNDFIENSPNIDKIPKNDNVGINRNLRESIDK